MAQKKVVYVPTGPSNIQCACGAAIEMRNFSNPGSNEICKAGTCKSCDREFVAIQAMAGESPFKKLVYLSDTHHVHCSCGSHVHLDTYPRPGSLETVEIGYCVPCGIEYRSM